MGAEKEERLLAESKFPLVPPGRNKGTCLVRLKGSKKPFWEVGHALLGQVPGTANRAMPQCLNVAWNLGRNRQSEICLPAAEKLCFAQTSLGKLSSSGGLQGYQRSTHKAWTSIVLCLLQEQILPLKFLPSHLSLLVLFLFCCLMTITEIMDRI